jgi:hypothetical protein
MRQIRITKYDDCFERTCAFALITICVCYAEKWKLSVNINKTKIVVFRNGGILSDDEQWYYNQMKNNTYNTDGIVSCDCTLITHIYIVHERNLSWLDAGTSITISFIGPCLLLNAVE